LSRKNSINSVLVFNFIAKRFLMNFIKYRWTFFFLF
jgi:hypothetical protein